MENKLQELTKKLYDEGLEKGRAEADRLVGEAKNEAAKIVAEARAQADVASQHELHRGRFMDAYAAPAARCIAVAADVAAVADARAFPEEPLSLIHISEPTRPY